MAKVPFTDTLSQRPGRQGMTPFAAGAVAVVLLLVVAYWAYTKANPFDDPYELNFVVRSTNEMKARSPVRVAGVEVGKVTNVEPIPSDERDLLPGHADESYAKVTMRIDDEEALPIKQDATIKIRNRIFLEGNYFVELHPGSPSAEEIDSGSTLPPNQADFPTQQHQVLQDVLRSDQRTDFRIIFDELSTALEGSGAAGFNEAIRYWERAYRDSAQVSEAYLGTENHDLSRLLRGQAKVFGALSRNESALKGFVTNLNRTASAFAVQEDNLKATIPQLRDVLRVGRPALQSLNSALPSIRAFSREALPGTRAASPTLDAQIPLVQQLRALVSQDELQGLAADLRDAVPDIVKLNQGSTKTFKFTRALSACQNNVLVPFAKEPIPDPDFAVPGNADDDNSGEPWFKQQQRAFVGLAGESRLFDGNSSYFRVQAGGGPLQLATTGETGDEYFARQLFPIEGVRPISPLEGSRPKFRPDQPCELQEVPDLHAEDGSAAEQEINPRNVRSDAASIAREARSRREWAKVTDHMRRQARGLRTFDPLVYTGANEKEELDRLGLIRLRNGKLADAPRRAEAGFTDVSE